MRALLFASAAALALAGCGEDEVAETEDMTAAEAEMEAPLDEAEAEQMDMVEAEPEEEASPYPPAPEFTPDPDVAEQRPPNAWLVGMQEPAFENQTRAPIPAETHDWVLEEVASGLNHPWGLELMPDGDFLITERNPGTMRIVSTDGEVSEPITGAPDVVSGGGSQGGLFDVALAPDFEESRQIYFSYAAAREEDKNTTVLATATLPEGATALENVETLFEMSPAWASGGHFGGRITWDEAGEHLFLTLGERALPDARVTAQTPDDHIGTIVRLNPDGSIPEDNPYADGGGAPEVWSYGHRSVQAADIDPVTGNFWSLEHGPRGGDELNMPQAGMNYGWPVIAYGIDYSGAPMGDFETQRDGMEQPVYYWDPVVAPGGMAFYRGDMFPNWTNDLFIGGESSQRVSRLTFNEDRTRVTGEEWLPIGSRVRELKTGPEGALYLITEEENGRLLRLVPE